MITHTNNNIVSLNSFKSMKNSVEGEYFSKLDFSSLINETTSLVSEINSDDSNLDNDLMVKVTKLTNEFESRIKDGGQEFDKYLLATLKDIKFSIKALM